MLATEPATNTVVVGESTLLSVNTIATRNLVWQSAPEDLVVDEDAQEAFGTAMGARALRDVPENVFTVQIRAHGTPTVVSALQIESGHDGDALEHLVVKLAEPIRGVAPGQSLVVYKGRRVVAEGTIATAVRTAMSVSSSQRTNVA